MSRGGVGFRCVLCGINNSRPEGRVNKIWMLLRELLVKRQLLFSQPARSRPVRHIIWLATPSHQARVCKSLLFANQYVIVVRERNRSMPFDGGCWSKESAARPWSILSQMPPLTIYTARRNLLICMSVGIRVPRGQFPALNRSKRTPIIGNSLSVVPRSWCALGRFNSEISLRWCTSCKFRAHQKAWIGSMRSQRWRQKQTFQKEN